MKRWSPLRWAVLSACAGAIASSCGSAGQTGSETHWYSLCERDQDCTGALRCICRVCSRSCAPQMSCGASAACVDALNSAIHAVCGDQTPPHDVCAATCTTTSECPRGLRCQEGICVRPIATANPAPSGDASIANDGGSGPEDAAVRDAAAPHSRDGAQNVAPDANYDWNTACPTETPPLGGSRLVAGPTVIMVSAPSGVYFGTPSAIGTGVIVRRLAPNGREDMPLGDRWLPLGIAGPGGLFYSTSSGFHWYSPSEGRDVATWRVDELIPMFVGDHVVGVQKLGADGGGGFRIVDIDPAIDAGEPTTHPYNPALRDLVEEPALMVFDQQALYYSISNTIYELGTSGVPTKLATVEGLLWSLTLSPDTLFVSRWTQSTPAVPGGIVAVDRRSGTQTSLVRTDEIHETAVFGDALYYATPDATGKCFELRRVPVAGGVAETLATSSILSFVFGPSQLYVATFNGLYQVPE